MSAFVIVVAASVLAHPRTVEKVEPPNWWAGMTVNPVRVLLRGTDLGGNISTNSPALRASNPKGSRGKMR